MSEPIAVDCEFDEDGFVRVRRIKLDDHWLHVEQGRQWLDENGRHILIMIPGSEVQEILLSPGTLQWQLLPHRMGPPIV
jgi:hypothetical protein